MNYNILTIPNFDKELKRLSKKYHSLKLEIVELGHQLEINPQIGNEILSHCYKIRLSIASKGKGKRGGARVITYVYISGKKVFLLSIYDKSEKNDISDKELKDLISSLGLE